MAIMNYTLQGHDYYYAVDQTAAALQLDDGVYSSLSVGDVWATAVCNYKGFRGIARWKTEGLNDSTAQRIIKTSIYRAVRASGMQRPPWGALTGVRPGKLMRQIMNPALFEKEYDVTPERALLCYETSLYTENTCKLLQGDDVCLYVGVPFCPTRCAYCSFVSQSVEKSMSLIEPFVEALFREIDRSEINGRIAAIYFGGGTPTTLSAAQLDALCCRLEEKFDLSHHPEFTVEAGRPDTITEEKLKVLKAHHVTRVSVNPQTMRDEVLEAIGRRHSAQDIRQALDTVRKVGGFDVNTDLIAGLPSDSLEGFRYTVDEVIAMAPENITVHTLSLKNGSSITLNKTELPSAEEVGLMLDYAYEKLRSAGYAPYYLYRQKNMSGGFENTGWTKPGHENIYNICMMEELCSIYAFGTGGSSKIIENGKITRKVNPKYPLEYIKKYV